MKKNGYAWLLSRYSNICDKHLIFSVLLSIYSAVISNCKILISSYVDILYIIAEFLDIKI